MDAKEKIREGWIHLNAIIEVLGKPKEYVDEILHGIEDHMRKDKSMGVISANYAEPKEQETMFSAFVEMEMIVKDLNILQGFIFDYMPSSVEIISPTELRCSLYDANSLFNDLASKLHNYDANAKKINMINALLLERAKELEAKIAELEKKEPAAEEKKEGKDIKEKAEEEKKENQYPGEKKEKKSKKSRKEKDDEKHSSA